MKIVINSCFGGFGLSQEAQKLLVGCPHAEVFEPKEYYGGEAGWEERFAADQKNKFLAVLIHDGKVVCDKHESTGRDCKKLVEVVEKLGVKADGNYAKLKIVEIPDGVEFEISYYDGMEHVAEAHRTWG